MNNGIGVTGAAALLMCGACAAVTAGRDGRGTCLEVESITARYFPGDAPKTAWQWLARRLCEIREPSFASSRRPPPERAVRCSYNPSFKPLVVIRLEERRCVLEATSFDELGKDEPRIQRQRIEVPSCSSLVDRFIEAVRAGGGAEPDQDVFDASSWSAEVLDERGHSYAEIRRPIEDRQRQRGIAAACQVLMDAAGTGPAPP